MKIPARKARKRVVKKRKKRSRLGFIVRMIDSLQCVTFRCMVYESSFKFDALGLPVLYEDPYFMVNR